MRFGRIPVRSLARPGRFLRYYGWNLLLTFGSGLVVFMLIQFVGLPAQQCYYLVVLSILLVHYCHDSVLFAAESEAAPFAAPAARAARSVRTAPAVA